MLDVIFLGEKGRKNLLLEERGSRYFSGVAMTANRGKAVARSMALRLTD